MNVYNERSIKLYKNNSDIIIIISNILKMNTLKKAKVIKIVAGTIYHLLGKTNLN